MQARDFPSNSSFTALGDKCKEYERQVELVASTDEVLIARLDGRAFHTLVKHFEKPFDKGLHSVMIYCTQRLVEEFHADFGYTQSDEISLVWTLRGVNSQFPFGGKFFKINSVLAGLCSSVFNLQYIGTRLDKIATFDCRSYTVPSVEQATDVILWRVADAKRNSLNSLAYAHFSHKALEGKHTGERLEMLKAAGIDWHKCPEDQKFGTFVFRDSVEKELTAEELAKMPEKYRVTGPVIRSILEIEKFDLTTIKYPTEMLFPQDHLELIKATKRYKEELREQVRSANEQAGV